MQHLKIPVNPLLIGLETIAISGITAFQLFLIVLKTLEILEIACNMKAIPAVTDGSSPNRTVFSILSDILQMESIT